MSEPPNNVIPLRPKAKASPCCPICAKPSEAEHLPFCSRRCADIDLHKWFGEAYTIEGRPEDDAADSDDPA